MCVLLAQQHRMHIMHSVLGCGRIPSWLLSRKWHAAAWCWRQHLHAAVTNKPWPNLHSLQAWRRGITCEKPVWPELLERFIQSHASAACFWAQQSVLASRQALLATLGPALAAAVTEQAAKDEAAAAGLFKLGSPAAPLPSLRGPPDAPARSTTGTELGHSMLRRQGGLIRSAAASVGLW